MLGLLLAAGCAPTEETPLVAFGQGTQVGGWAVSAAGTAAAAPRLPAASAPPAAGLPVPGAPPPAGAAGVPSGPVVPNMLPGVLPPPVAGSAPVRPAGAAGAAPVAAAGSLAPPPGLPVAGSAAPAAGSGAPAAGTGAPAGGGPVTSLTFDVTTTPVGGRYQPKNVGAIWIQDSSGKLLKSLKVWAGIRRIWLTTYGSLLGFSPVDVMASATLSSHKTHHVTWDLKDVDGMAVPPGKYTLMMEITDSDAPGRTNMISFDTSAGPMMMMPPNAPSFTTMTLQLQ